ncbi:cytosine deaminase [Trichosporon asahii var. asahii CBS 8904]|uniref:Cytosine deaminase n=1 Tax=Trichosporon asahii var. asahii (strain CBS 8904) TaxID=1220162 RepID=K1VUR0_TRIAC|nr:cytosine deaminase [Trichosporon asahii var. asahii CBS 8904]
MAVTKEQYPEFMKMAAIVHLPTGKVLAKGHNQRVQLNSNIRHGEMDALENLGRVNEGVFRECAMFTTLSPCIMFPLVVLAENENFVGGEDLLRSKGVEVVNLQNPEITKMMSDWIAGPVGQKVWNEDIGEVTA